MFPDRGHGPCSDCQEEKFDPWNIVAVPMWWAIIGAYAVRDLLRRFISALRKSKS